MKSTKLTLAIVSVLAVIAGLGMYSFLSSAKTTIYLFNDDYKAGTKITDSILVAQDIDSSIVKEVQLANTDGKGALYITKDTKNQILGDSLKGDVVRGTPFMTSETTKLGGSAAELRLDANTVAVTVPVDNASGVSAFITAGSRVNVFVGLQGNNGNATENMILQNVKVVDVSYSEVKNDSTASPTLSGVTVQVSPDQAVALNFGIEFGKVRLGIVKQGSQAATVSTYTMDNIKPMNEPATSTQQ